MAEPLLDKLRHQLIYVTSRQRDCGFNVVSGVEVEVKSISHKLGLLKVVERNQLRERDVRSWMETLEDLAYDFDDLLDEWNIEIHKYQIREPRNHCDSSLTLIWDKVCFFFGQVSVGCGISLKIKQLNNRLDMILLDKDRFNFIVSRLNNEIIREFRPSSTSLVDESEIRGRKNDKDIIVNELLFSQDDNNIRIVSIVGTAGIGKTTLAQMVYNDNQVNDHFEVKLWVCVSKGFDPKSIANAILECLEKSSPSVSEFETLLCRIRVLISRKKFLLVLDDVWTEDNRIWEPIVLTLKGGDPGSRILLTTRSEWVARMVRTHYFRSLDPLYDSDCWSIMSRIAFNGISVRVSEDLEEIGFEISRKCKGLPLAAKVLGGLLRFKNTKEQWQSILEREIWELEEAATHLFPSIYLSFEELTSEMKHCFLYCAVFPKDFQMDVEQLSRLWSAQGYLCSLLTDEELESKGYWNFRYLVMRSFFTNLVRDPYDETRVIKCKLHGIIHDFAQHLLNGKCLTVKNLDEAKKLSCRKVRHLTWFHGDVSISSLTSHVGILRSFCSFYCISVASDLFNCMKRVRTLILYGAWLEEVPRAVGKLIHLRYLDLSRNNYLNELPDGICDLYHLETLDITDCPKLTRLPQNIGNLVNLRYLLNSGTNIKDGPEKLTSLRILKELKVGGEYNKLDCLRNLNHVGGEISIEFFGEVNEINFGNARLRDKAIRGLVFKFYESAVRVSELPRRLEHLSTYFYPHSALPNCITSLDSLKRLNISFGSVSSLPALWRLPSLEILQLFALRDIEVLGRDFLGTTESPIGFECAFPRLKKIKFSHLQNLRTWEDLGEMNISSVFPFMPCLRELDLYECRELQMLPHRLLHQATLLEVLDLRSCTALARHYNSSADGWNHVSQIPNVLIDRSRQVPLT